MRLDRDEAFNTYVTRAFMDYTENRGYRFGQALWNLLPIEIIEDHVGTDSDFYYEEDSFTALCMFYTNFVVGE